MITSSISKVVDKALEGDLLNREEIAALFAVNPLSEESGYIKAAARRLSAELCGNKAEIHCHVGINLGPCIRNCRWCSFAAVNNVFPKAQILPTEEIVERCLKFETEGVNSIYLVSTGTFSFKRLTEIVKEVRRNLKPDTVLIANADDFNLKQAQELKDAGLNGVYHAVRFREGIESDIPVEKRFKTMRAAHEVGLTLGTCVEPIGPEHSIEELVEATIIARECGAVFSGTMKRIAIPNTEIGARGMLSEERMAYYLAVIRLATQQKMIGMCWHEPSLLGPTAGANLMWAETGSSPRDTHEDCENTRGRTVAEIRDMYHAVGWEVREGPSQIWNTVPEKKELTDIHECGEKKLSAQA